MLIAGRWQKLALSKPAGALVGVGIKSRPNDVPGTTGFFRLPDLLDRIIDYLENADLPPNPRLLFAPSSVGCDVYSFVMRAHGRGLFKKYPDLKVYALDVAPEYLNAGRTAAFPDAFVENLDTAQKKYFTKIEDGHETFNQLPASVYTRVVFLPAQDIIAHKPEDGVYDVSVCLYLFRHFKFSPEKRQAALTSLLRSSRLVCLNNSGLLPPRILRSVFKSFSDRPVFSPLDAGMKPLPPVSPNASTEMIERFRQSRTNTTDMFIYRHNS